MRRGNPLTRLLVRGSPEVFGGRIAGLPVEKPVEVLRDRYGIPHIFAASERDLMVAQGFVHAQDRLWQMETLRRLCSGKLAALVGAAAVEVDHFTHLIGLPRLWERAVRAVGEGERLSIEAYAAGVNAFLETAGRRLPLELRSLGGAPAPWTPGDVLSFVPYLAWNQQTNYLDELLAILARGRVTATRRTRARLLPRRISSTGTGTLALASLCRPPWQCSPSSGARAAGATAGPWPEERAAEPFWPTTPTSAWHSRRSGISVTSPARP